MDRLNGKLSKIYFGTNTKMYKNTEETVSFVRELENAVADMDRERFSLFVIPSFTSIGPAAALGGITMIGAQNMGWVDEGALTGEISPLMLKEAGAALVMAGHSERRHIFGETDFQENKKILCALGHGFTALLCVGETKGEKECGIADEVLRIQLKTGLKGVDKEQAEWLYIAYEPVWAIGEGGEPAGREYAREKHSVIRQVLTELFGSEAGGQIPILYGGSVNLQNAPGLIGTEGVDGLFIGRSAWDAKNFGRIIHECFDVYAKIRDCDTINSF